MRCCALLSQTQQLSNSSSRQAICNILDVVPSMKDANQRTKATKKYQSADSAVCQQHQNLAMHCILFGLDVAKR